MTTKILAFDTATRATAVALELGEEHVVEARDDPGPAERPAHATRLLALAVQLLDEANLGWQELDRLAVGTGPGTFTGLRIGIATARALAHALGIPLAGVSTLQALASRAAREAREESDAGEVKTVMALIDARRGEVFVAAWSGSRSQPMAGPAALAPDRLDVQVRRLPAPILAVGDGAVAFREVLEGYGVLVPPSQSQLHKVTATEHCRLARGAVAGDPEEVHPEYIRLPDAEISRRAQENR